MIEYKRLTDEDGAKRVMSQWAGTSAELKIYRRLAELEDKIESGELIFDTRLKPKYKVGDTVYYVRLILIGGVRFDVVKSKIQRICRGEKTITYYLKNSRQGFSENRIYVNREDAEEELKKLQEGK